MLVYSFLNIDVYYFIRIKEYLGLAANICWHVCRNTSSQICSPFIAWNNFLGKGILHAHNFCSYRYRCMNISHEDEKGNEQFVDKISENYVMLTFQN